MNILSLNIQIGLRYIKAKRRNSFISFISFISIGGIALGVAVLITVISVMNGFQRDLQQRILGMAAHATISTPTGKLKNWQEIMNKAEKHAKVLGAAPYIEKQAMVTSPFGSTGVLVRGINPELEPKVSDINNKIVEGEFTSLTPRKFNTIIGEGMSLEYGLKVGDKINIIVPMTDASIIGIMPRTKQFTISGIFKIGMYEYDRKMILVNVKDAAVLYKIKRHVSGVRLKVKDMLKAYLISRDVASQLDNYLVITDWTQRHASFFKAIKTEKVVMFIILSLIVMTAAFNIVSTMVMVVTDKESEIAILRTLGMQPISISQIFLTQGIVIGLVGTVIGIILGVSLSLNVEQIVRTIENLIGTKFLAAEVYYISDIPSQLKWLDVLMVGGLSFIMATLATWYPARRASKVKPAEALRYE